MKARWKKIIALVSVMLLLGSLPVLAAVATFDDLSLAPNSYWNGSDGSGGFTSGNMSFSNNYNSTYSSWDGFAYSNMTDTTTSGPGNQYSAITGGGVNGSSNYGVSYMGYSTPPTITFSGSTDISGMYVTNTTYAYLSMKDGDSFAKQFGGDDGNDPDWFKLTVTGAKDGSSVGSVDFYLADFRFDDNSQDYILSNWTWLDLSGLGEIDTLTFSESSSDVGSWGMNTPAYFAFDDVTGSPVPIPGAVWLLGSGLLGLVGIRRKQKV